MGKEANKTGQKLEDLVEGVIKEKDFAFVEKNKYKDSKSSSQKIYTKQLVVGETIYGTKRKCDFITYNPHTKREIVIECKWQDTPGSVDEKYPFLVLNIKKIGIDTIIILDGDGYKKKAMEWLKDQMGDCLIGVMGFSEFMVETRKKDLI